MYILKQVILSVEDKKYSFLRGVLKHFDFVKIKPISSYKAKIFENIKNAVDEMTLIEDRKLQGRDAKDFLNEL